MEELKVIGVEDGALLVASDEGTRFRVAIDDALHSSLRRTPIASGTAPKLAPRDIQAHIRSGMSAEDVAAVTGAPLDYIQRFEGPVIAEREYVIESALNVTVHTAVETDPMLGGSTFGSVIRERLADMGATGERWASWKEQGGGWIVKLTFAMGAIERDARWSFEPKKGALAPLNPEAISLSQQGELPASLLPRLRAVPLDELGDTGRFDSGAFDSVVTEVETASDEDSADGIESVSVISIVEKTIARNAQRDDLDDDITTLFDRMPETAAFDQDDTGSHHQTADLLEALRRRRGERDPLDLEHEESMAAHPSTGSVRLIDVPLDGVGDAPAPAKPIASKGSPSAGSTGAPSVSSRKSGPFGKRGGRTAMPSWDEIVFGARPDDDL